jgi:hypothetical protein
MEMNVMQVAVKQEVATEEGSGAVEMDVEIREVSKPLAKNAISSPRSRSHAAAALRQTYKRRIVSRTPERETSRKKVKAENTSQPAREATALASFDQLFSTPSVAPTGRGPHQPEEEETFLPRQTRAVPRAKEERAQTSKKRDQAPAPSLALKQESRQASTREVVVPPPLAHPKPTPQPSQGCVLGVHLCHPSIRVPTLRFPFLVALDAELYAAPS